MNVILALIVNIGQVHIAVECTEDWYDGANDGDEGQDCETAGLHTQVRVVPVLALHGVVFPLAFVLASHVPVTVGGSVVGTAANGACDDDVDVVEAALGIAAEAAHLRHQILD